MSAPTFEEASNRRQKVRAAGMDPNYWYAVSLDEKVQRGQVVEVRFWNNSVALYRDSKGELHAMEDRCAHRQIKLSKGQVVGDRLVCDYHGWEYDRDGKLAKVPHELFGHRMPQCKLKSFAVRVRYGLIWIFFGDQDKAWTTPLPAAPELEQDDPWACVPIEFTWKAHHSMIMDNVSDFTHEYLHRRYKPFTNAKLTSLKTEGDIVSLSYDTAVGGGKLTSLFMDKKNVGMDSIELAYEYPYQRSNTNDYIKHWCLVLPEDERTTKVFFLFYFKSFNVPFTSLKFPRRLMEPIIKMANRMHVIPLLEQDGTACAEEQAGYERHYDAPIAELSPAVHAFQALTIRKWEEFLAREDARGTKPGSGLIDASKLTRKPKPAPETAAAE
ncbi:MAG: Rieske 2Fe-2S domain-containing protein [Polyangiaceae bacterium]